MKLELRPSRHCHRDGKGAKVTVANDTINTSRLLELMSAERSRAEPTVGDLEVGEALDDIQIVTVAIVRVGNVMIHVQTTLVEEEGVVAGHIDTVSNLKITTSENKLCTRTNVITVNLRKHNVVTERCTERYTSKEEHRLEQL